MKFSWKALVGALLISISLVSVWLRFSYINPTGEDRYVDIPKGTSSYGVASLLGKNFLERHKIHILLRLSGYGRRVQAGEYRFSGMMTWREVFHALKHAHQRVPRKVRIIEGMTVAQALRRLNRASGLEGASLSAPLEGMIFPDTYIYYKGDARLTLYKKMVGRMEVMMKELWGLRDKEKCHVSSPEQLLALASLVEKETSVPKERARVAGVYLNRLKIGMRLQADPTVLYGLRKEKGRSKELSRDDLRKPHPYNTYLNYGLPPTAICIPSLASLRAAAFPQPSGNLYFVAKGDGSHIFSRNLAEHRVYHQKLRQLRRKKAS